MNPPPMTVAFLGFSSLMYDLIWSISGIFLKVYKFLASWIPGIGGFTGKAPVEITILS